jgi:hypothetical protein
VPARHGDHGHEDHGSKKGVIEHMTYLTLAGEFRSLVFALGGTIACQEHGLEACGTKSVTA